MIFSTGFCGFRIETIGLQIVVSLQVMCHFFLSAFKILGWGVALVFQVLIRMCPGMDFFFLSLSYVEFTQFPGCVFYQILEVSTIISSHILSAPHPFTCLSRTQVIQILDLLLLFHRYLRPCSCFSNLHFLCCSDWVNSTILPSGSLLLALIISHHSVEPSSSLIFPLIIFFSPIVSIWFFSYNFYVEVFYFFICLNKICEMVF